MNNGERRNGPTLLGTIIDLAGGNFRLLFVYATCALLVAVLLLLRVRRGEAHGPPSATRVAPAD